MLGLKPHLAAARVPLPYLLRWRHCRRDSIPRLFHRELSSQRALTCDFYLRCIFPCA